VGGSTAPATIANPRHADLERALGTTKTLQSSVDPRLKDAVSAMRGHAWSGTSASDTFFSELSAHVRAIHTATQGCVDNVSDALAHCPARIPDPNAKHKK
jgi:hypothetical protein